MLKNFNMQKDLSCHQAWWMQFDTRIVYIKCEDNSVADALSCLPCLQSASGTENAAFHPYTLCVDNTGDAIASIWTTDCHGPLDAAMSLTACELPFNTINATMKITADKDFLNAVKAGYTMYSRCKMLGCATASLPGLVLCDGLC